MFCKQTCSYGARLISYIHHTSGGKHSPVQNRIISIFWFRWTCIFGSHTFVPISWMFKKQTSVSHSSTESEIISLDAGLRLDGLPALELWDLIVSVLGNTIQTPERPGRPAYISLCKFTHGWNTSSGSLEFGCRSLSLFSDSIKETKDQTRGNLLRDTISNKRTQNQTEDPTKHNNLELSNVDYDSSNAKSSLFCSMLYFWGQWSRD